MSIHKHEYRSYNGRTTSMRSRILVLARYGFAEAWSSKITVGLFILCMVPALLALVGIYLANNPVAAMLIGRGSRLDVIDADFFLHVLEVQCWLALVLASWIAPRLMTFDLADNALPILLSHPISRVGYVLGKYIALFAALSAVTWIPVLLLFAYQGYSSAQPWAANNMHIAVGMFAGSIFWIAFLSIFGLALSSWVKWRVVATGAIFAAILVPAGVGAIISQVLRTDWGFLLNLPVMMALLWQRLLRVQGMNGTAHDLPTSAIATMLILACVLCVAMLNKRIRAREVVRG